MDLPHLPEEEGETLRRATSTLRAKIVWLAVTGVLALIIVLHLTGVLGESQVGH